MIIILLTYILVLGTAATVVAVRTSCVTADLFSEKNGVADSIAKAISNILPIRTEVQNSIANSSSKGEIIEFDETADKLRKCFQKDSVGEVSRLTRELKRATGEKREALSRELDKETQMLNAFAKPAEPSTRLSILSSVSVFCGKPFLICYDRCFY